MSSSTKESSGHTSCLVIGGGISGLVAANVIQDAGISVSILDKGKAVGGRLATRRHRIPSICEATFDYGAQLFTASSPAFQKMIDKWQQLGKVTEWGTQIYGSDEKCYRGTDSNRSLALFLAKDSRVYSQCHVTRVDYSSSFWHVQARDGREFTSQALIMTCPIPQALFLLKQSKLVLPSNLLGRLESIIYSRCIAGLAILENDSDIPEPGGVRLDNESISWLACNRKKGISHSNAITLLTTPEFSIRHWDDDDSQIALLMVDSARPYLGSEVLDAHIHRWRYSQPCTFFGDHYLALREPGVLIMAGDAFSPNHTISPILNLERAALSGLQAANYYIQNQDYFV